MTVPPSTRGGGRDGAPLRIGNASGFYGDRFDAFARCSPAARSTFSPATTSPS